MRRLSPLCAGLLLAALAMTVCARAGRAQDRAIVRDQFGTQRETITPDPTQTGERWIVRDYQTGLKKGTIERDPYSGGSSDRYITRDNHGLSTGSVRRQK